MVAFSEQLPECREPLYAQPPTEAKLGDLNQNLDGKRGPESWLFFHIREGNLPVFLSVLQLGGGVLKRQEGECLFLGPKAHPGLFLPGQPCIESFLWEVSVHKLHVIPVSAESRGDLVGQETWAGDGRKIPALHMERWGKP